MIRYSLICDKGHEYEAWFQSASAYEKQVKAGLLECAVCGSKNVQKALMAPNISTNKKRQASDEEKLKDKPKLTDKKSQDIAKAIKTIRKKIEENADYVGDRFAEEARKIYYKEDENRGIYGEASKEEVKELGEEGIPILPVPNLPEDQN